ncbi:DKNYY domain-containing protein [Escherichia albertii]|uniref:DKNYY domain-containing protein n=1 Tax=Escherichia albertii TaxID=208962 RepID=UPI00223BDA28|nr:DKNYY domain-containing protein [Escherichia albertii]
MNVSISYIRFMYVCIFVISILYSLTACTATIHRCNIEFHDGESVETKSCADKGKKIGSTYSIYDNKVWYVSERNEYDNIHGGRRGCPNPSCVGVISLNLNPLPEVENNILTYTRLPLDVNKVHVLGIGQYSIYKNVVKLYGTGHYITDGKVVFYKGDKINVADPATFQTYDTTEPQQISLGKQLSWDSKWLYVNAKKSNIPVTGKVKVINSSLIVSGNDVYELKNADNDQDDEQSFDYGNFYFTKIDNISASLRSLPGKELSTDGKYLLYRSKIIDKLDAHGISIVKQECPVSGYPLISCFAEHKSTLLKSKDSLWIQLEKEEPKKITLGTNDAIRYVNGLGTPFLIIDDKKIYNLECGMMTSFSGFLANNADDFLEERGMFRFENNGNCDQSIANRRFSVRNYSQSPDGLYRLKTDKNFSGDISGDMNIDGRYEADHFIFTDNHHEYQLGRWSAEIIK